MEAVDVHDVRRTEDRLFEICSAEGGGKLLLGEDGAEVVRISSGI